MPKIRKRARGFVEYAAKYHEPVQWAHFDDPDDESIYYHEIRSGVGVPDRWYDTPIWVIPNTYGRNAHGGSSTYDMSNHRSMLRDFPNGKDGLIVVRWNNVDELAIRLDKAGRELLDACRALLDYPIYDESDLVHLEQELEVENWDLYGRRDFVSELEWRDYSADDVLYRVCEHTYDPHGFHGVRATYTKPDLTTGRQGLDGRIDVRLIESD